MGEDLVAASKWVLMVFGYKACQKPYFCMVPQMVIGNKITITDLSKLLGIFMHKLSQSWGSLVFTQKVFPVISKYWGYLFF